MKKIIFAMLMLVSLNSFASGTDRGTWFCQGCNFGGIGLQGEVGLDDAITFIKDQNSNIIPNTYDRWMPKDTIKVCDGVSCMTVTYLANGNWIAPGITIKDPGKYKNGNKKGVTSTKVGSAAGSDYYAVVAHGHWETWTDYSDGHITEVEDPIFVVDYFDVTFHMGADCPDSACGKVAHTDQ